MLVSEDVIVEEYDSDGKNGINVTYDSTELIGVTWDSDEGVRRFDDVPWDYVNSCQVALSVFDDAVDWNSISPNVIRERLERTKLPRKIKR
jgi:hypothetical protein